MSPLSPRLRRTLVPLVLSTVALGCAAQKPATLASPSDEEARAARAPAPQAPAAPAVPEEQEALQAPTLYYTLDSSQLTDASREQLAALAQALRTRREVGVTIAGHTCELGTAEYNLALGQQRAARARDYLVALGVEPGRISTVTYGEESPVDEGADEASRAKNRRSELTVSVSSQHAVTAD